MNRNRLKQTLEKDEGYRQFPYRCTANKLTIAIGRNIEEKGISYTEALFLLNNDIEEVAEDLKKIFKDFDRFPDHIQEVLANMRFQMGPRGFRSFNNMINAVNAWDFSRMQIEMMDSKWARHDTPQRARKMLEIVKHGFKEK
jgi:lysozyme